KGETIVRGQRAPIVGRVSMDYATIDVGHIRGVQVGDRVTLIGTDGHETITAEELARKADTIAYEITCAVGKRVRRTYLGDREVIVPARAPRARDASAREPGVREPSVREPSVRGCAAPEARTVDPSASRHPERPRD